MRSAPQPSPTPRVATAGCSCSPVRRASARPRSPRRSPTRPAPPGAIVRTGACWETEGLPPFTPWLDVLRRPGGDACAAVAAQLDAGIPEAPDAASAARAQARLFADVVDALYTVGADHPQVVLLEDLHWADGASLELLAALAPHLPSLPVLVVATYRDDELPRTSPLAGLGGQAERLTVTGLDASRGRGPPHRRAQPPRHRRRSGRRRAPDGRQPAVRHPGGPAHRRGLGGRARRGPRRARAAPGPRRARRARTCWARPRCSATSSTKTCSRRWWVSTCCPTSTRRVPPAWSPRSTPSRCGGASSTPSSRPRGTTASRRRSGRGGTDGPSDALRDRPGTTAATLAHHAIRARYEPTDSEPAELLVAAGQEALDRLAWTDAATAFERALAAAPEGPTGDDARVEAWLGIGAARLRQDRADVRDAFDEAVAIARRMDRPDLVARAALGFGVGLGAFEVRLLDHRQIDLLEEAAATLDVSSPLLPLVLARLSVALAFVDSDERRAELAIRAVDLARTARRVRGPRPRAGGPLRRLRRSRPHRRSARRRGRDRHAGPAGRRPAAGAPRTPPPRRRAVREPRSWRRSTARSRVYERPPTALGDPLYTWFVPLWRAARAWNRGAVTEAHAAGGRGRADRGARRQPEQRPARGRVPLHGGHRGPRPGERRGAGPSDARARPRHPRAVLRARHRVHRGRTWATPSAASAALGQVGRHAIEALPRDSEWVCWLVQTDRQRGARRAMRRGARWTASCSRRCPAPGPSRASARTATAAVDRFLALAARRGRRRGGHPAARGHRRADGGRRRRAARGGDRAWTARGRSTCAGAPEDAERVPTPSPRALARPSSPWASPALVAEADGFARHSRRRPRSTHDSRRARARRRHVGLDLGRRPRCA